MTFKIFNITLARHFKILFQKFTKFKKNHMESVPTPITEKITTQFFLKVNLFAKNYFFVVATF